MLSELWFLSVLLNIVGFDLFQLLMLLTFNHSFYCCQLWTLKHILCNSGVEGGCLVKMCGKTGDGTCGLVSDNFSISSPPGLCQWVGVSLTWQPEGSHFSWTPLFRSQAKTDWFCMSSAGNYSDETDLLGFPPECWQFCQPWWQRVSDEVDGQLLHFLHTRPSL